jgi:chaperone required for assembly of F1-ATPase
VPREPLRPGTIRRFFATATVAADAAPLFRILLDGRPVRTPKKRLLELPSRVLADAIADEWTRQGAEIDPATMPLTRIANSTLDGVAGNEQALRDDIAAYAMNDLVCYRAEGPPELVRRQAALWDPVVGWVGTRLGVRLRLAEGVMPVVQPDALRDGFLARLAGHDAFRLAALHVVTTLTGSAAIALALDDGAIDAAGAWAAAHVDEDFQISQWGQDAEAEIRRQRRWAEMQAAVAFLGLAAARA